MTIENFKKAQSLVPEINDTIDKVKHLKDSNASVGIWINNKSILIPDDLGKMVWKVVDKYYQDELASLNRKLQQL